MTITTPKFSYSQLGGHKSDKLNFYNAWTVGHSLDVLKNGPSEFIKCDFDISILRVFNRIVGEKKWLPTECGRVYSFWISPKIKRTFDEV